MKMPEPVIIVLAAGLSRRFGTQNKLLIDWEGEPLIRRVVRTALASTSPPLPAERGGAVIVVTGHEAAQIEAVLIDLPVMFARNKRYREGMSGSIAAGVRAAAKGARGFLIVPGDMPRLSVKTLMTLAGLEHPVSGRQAPPDWAGDPDDGVLIATCRATWGRTAPTYFDGRLRSELESLEGDAGARFLFLAHQGEVWDLAVHDAEVSDID